VSACIHVGVAAFVLRDGKFLVGCRKNTQVGDGWFGLPGGHVELMETLGQSAMREVEEETGIVVCERAGGDVRVVTTETELFPEQGLHYVTSFVVLHCPSGVEPVNTEPDKCAGWQWVDVLSDPPEPCFPTLHAGLKALRMVIGVQKRREQRLNN